MILSMTGYGKAETVFASKKIIVEVKSLNGKQLDISTRLSSIYKEKDLELRSMVSDALLRGKVDLYVQVDNKADDYEPQINVKRFTDYKEQICKVAEATATPLPADLFTVLLRLPEVMSVEQPQLSEEEWAAVRDCAQEALDKLVSFRTQEGDGLQKFFTERLDTIEQLLQNGVPVYETARIDKIKSRMRESLSELQLKQGYDQNRFEQELIYYIEKLDISEEKQRLQNHIDYFRATMEEAPGQGRKLGFVAQEMGREINTMGSKANQADLQIIVVKMKDELEKIKEQVLNVL